MRKNLDNMDTNFSESASNASRLDELDPVWIGIVEAAILFLIMLLAIVGNFLVIAVVYRRRELRRTETHIFIVNLSFTDISVALLCMPFSLITAVTQEWIFSNPLCQLNGFLNVFFLLTSILTLTAISIQKYIGVVQPMKRRIFTRKTTIVAVLWVWFQALFTALTPILGWNSYEHIAGRTQCSVKVPRDNSVSELTNCLFIIVCGFVIPLGIMSFSYLKIFQTVKIHTKRVRSHSFGEEQSAFLNERRITVTLFIILAVFLACWAPFSVLTIYATLAGSELPKYFSVAAYWLGFLNSAMNPLIYALRTKEFRQGYRQIFGIVLPCCFRRVDSRESDSIAVLRGRRSLKSEVQMTKRRGQTQKESRVSENGHVDRKDVGNAPKRKETLTTEREESESARFDTANEFLNKHNESLCSESISKESCYSVNAMAVDVELNGVEIRQNGTICHGEEKTESGVFGEKEAKILSSNSDVSHGYLSPIRETLHWNSEGFPSEEAFPKNFEDNERIRRKSTSYLMAFQEQQELRGKLYRSKSDCSNISPRFGRERGLSCPFVDITKQTSEPWLRENLSYLNRIAPIEILEKTEIAD